ncbi:MAG TPA: protein-methionine-sulfoxide reductase heme-binding subunit MsrQ [Pyrinomonadaceae bacterium]|nr:protein-methionine-sulfoxide reductase heme-binding subunit MsrQ [Pyrinomonadaceae bacterium]
MKPEDARFLKTIIFVNSLVPVALLAWDASRGNLGANPLEYVTRTTGMLTLIFLVLSLAVTPLRKWTGWNWLGMNRRVLGLYAFFYGALHFLTYIWFDRFFNLKSAAGDVIQRPFIAVGFASFLIMIPLAVTSTNGMVKRLGGKRWNRLHKAVYVAASLGALHYWMLVKSDTRLPLAFAAVLALLLGYRIFAANRAAKPEAPTTIIPR